MTLREMTYDIKMKINRNILSDDSRLTNRLIRFWINNQRYKWVEREENKKYQHNNQLVQTISPMELIIVDSSSDTNLPVGYSALRTKKKIPRTIYFNEIDDGIISVGPIDQLQTRFTYINYNDIFYAGTSKYNTKEIFAFRSNDYIYILSKDQYIKGLGYVEVRGIYSNPMDLSNYTDNSGNKLFTIDSTYPITSKMWDMMKDELYKTNFDSLINTPTDDTNDATELKKD